MAAAFMFLGASILLPLDAIALGSVAAKTAQGSQDDQQDIIITAGGPLLRESPEPSSFGEISSRRRRKAFGKKTEESFEKRVAAAADKKEKSIEERKDAAENKKEKSFRTSVAKALARSKAVKAAAKRAAAKVRDTSKSTAVAGKAVAAKAHSKAHAKIVTEKTYAKAVAAKRAAAKAHKSIVDSTERAAAKLRASNVAAEKREAAKERAIHKSIVDSAKRAAAKLRATSSRRRPRRRRSAMTPSNVDRWCAIAQLGSSDLKLSKDPDRHVSQVNGYCYYLSKTGQSCTEACAQQMAGTCNAAGIEYAAENVGRCKNVLEAFGGLKVGNATESAHDRTGCTWSDLGESSKMQLMKKDKLYPLCSENHTLPNSHRVCACTAYFGNIGLYSDSVGECRSAGGKQYRTRTGTFKSAKECEDECTRDSACGAFAYVNPWDGHERACNFYAHDHFGDGGNKHVRCSVKESYLATVGLCKEHGGVSAKISEAKYDSVNACKAACDADENCKAYQVAGVFVAGDTCALYRAGHTGNGQHGQRCYTKSMGGITRG